VKKEGRIVGMRRVKRDVRERNQAEEELMRSVAKNESLLIAIPDLVFRLDKNGVFLEFIPEKEFSLWKPSSEFLGRSVYDVLDKKVARQFMQNVNRAIETGETQILEYQLSLNGKSLHYELRIMADGKGDILVVVRNFTRQKQAERMAAMDPLTHAYNRRKFSELLDQEIKRVERNDKSFSMVMLDIDHFKKINDTHGHDAGDYVLKRMTNLIRENIRDVDILSRYGGEEFVIILPERNLKVAIAVAERIRKVIESACFDKVGQITISAGVSDFMQGDSRESVFKKADKALYIAKNGGRNRVSVD
jgi:diguanylate cyclase (GGDEF)-like protein